MLTRYELDAALPPNEHFLTRLAVHFADIRKSNENRIDMQAGLEWLAKVTENDRFANIDAAQKYNWAKHGHPDYHPTLTPWPIEIDGLFYKKSSSYQAVEGWSIGTVCWYVRVHCGFLESIGAICPLQAVLRAVIFVGALIEVRKTKYPYVRTVMAHIEAVSKDCIA